MATERQRTTVYLDPQLYQRVQDLLAQSPEPYSFSRLVNELISDWYEQASYGPRFRDATPEQRREMIYELAFRQIEEVVSEAHQTLRHIRDRKEAES